MTKVRPVLVGDCTRCPFHRLDQDRATCRYPGRRPEGVAEHAGAFPSWCPLKREPVYVETNDPEAA